MPSSALAVNFVLAVAAAAVVLFFGILASDGGRAPGRAATRGRRRRGRPRAGVGAVEGAVYGLLGLLIAFTFSGAGLRFDHRRSLVVEEANAIGTAYLRIDLLPEDAQPALRGALPPVRRLASRGLRPPARHRGRDGRSWRARTPCRPRSGRPRRRLPPDPRSRLAHTSCCPPSTR